MTCSIDGCQLIERCKGLCEQHYQRKHYRMRRLEQGLPDPELAIACEVCGIEFVRRGPTVYCGPECRSIGHRARSHKRIYGLGRTEFFKMLKSQGGLCAICRRPEMTKKTLLSVDHCHTTGKVRGLLCHQCNLALGHFQDDPERLARASAYLGAMTST